MLRHLSSSRPQIYFPALLGLVATHFGSTEELSGTAQQCSSIITRMPRHGLSVSWTKSVGTLPSPSVDVVGTSLAAQTHPSRPLTLCPNPHSSITGGVTAPAARLKKRELLLPWQPQQPSPRSRRLLLKLPITSSEQDCQCQPQLLLAPCFLPLGLLIQ